MSCRSRRRCATLGMSILWSLLLAQNTSFSYTERAPNRLGRRELCRRSTPRGTSRTCAQWWRLRSVGLRGVPENVCSANSTLPAPSGQLLGASDSDRPSTSASSKGPVPLARVALRRFKILFGCKICDYKNSYMMSRLAYNEGIVIATCQGYCRNRHLISDKTGLMKCGKWDVEDLAAYGTNVTRMGVDGVRSSSADRTGSGATMEQELQQALIASEERVVLQPPDAMVDPIPGLLVKRSGPNEGLLEALLEDRVSMSTAVEFLADEDA
eukprot:TRINITY_DN100733_c0_g1_i1.p1 TRINITY_DN100733_c0_g1~~TRINITY_DN100733_c0_g1_i1.p1  ORF type:complete len:269 (-),score=21.76 TRINITY_DN100733_c0_g1_i1:63-869(-)